MRNLQFSKLKTIPKGEMLLRQGEIAKHGYFVKKGCLKGYTIDQSGKEHILQFAPESWLITDLDSFTNLSPTMMYIQAIEESEIGIVAKSDFEDLHSLEKEALIDMTIKFRNNVIAANKRIMGLLSSTSEERYITFTETYPTLVQRLPLKLIAAYIGVTPEYLSELRRKIAKK